MPGDYGVPVIDQNWICNPNALMLLLSARVGACCAFVRYRD